MHKRYIGSMAFYRRMLTIATPIILQNFITNFVSLLDNVMVGQLSTAQLGGVPILSFPSDTPICETMFYL